MVIRKTHGFSDPHRVCQEANAQGPPPPPPWGPPSDSIHGHPEWDDLQSALEPHRASGLP